MVNKNGKIIQMSASSSDVVEERRRVLQKIIHPNKNGTNQQIQAMAKQNMRYNIVVFKIHIFPCM